MAGGERPDPWRDEDLWPPEHVLERKRAAAARLGITPRRYEVLQLIAEGLTNREIGERLYITEETVKSHVKVIRAALGANHKAHLVAEAFRRDLLA